MTTITKQDILNFFKKQEHTVISTCGSNGQPEAALVGFGETDNLELIFGTFKSSKKYKNLKHNNKVAFVIGWNEDFITIQYEGVATELSAQEIEIYVPLYHKKVPSAAVYHTHPEQTYFKVSPTWIRYSDLSGEQEQITEYTF
jgi:pyridoxine/pyridoxamine 5'-phosphate oxidase